MKQLILENIDKHIATITLNRPEKNNAFNPELIDSVIAALDKLKNQTELKLLILKGAGENFCAGADINWMQQSIEFSQQQNRHDAAKLAELFKKLYEFPQPTLVVIQGAVTGGGLGLICCCDIALAESQATFCFTEVKLGLIPASISPYVIRAIGPRVAARYFLTAEKFDAAEALRINLIHDIAEKLELEKRAENYIQSISKNGPQSLKLAKKLIRQYQSIDSNFIEQTIDLIAQVRVSDEAQEGLKAFLEKRKPKWM